MNLSSEHLGQQALESYLWGAANLFRVLIHAGDYKQYVFPQLFFKRLSDVWEEDYRNAFDETSDRGYVQETANDRFVIPDGAHWSDVGREVKKALRMTLFKYRLHQDKDLFDRAYGYIRQYY